MRTVRVIVDPHIVVKNKVWENLLKIIAISIIISFVVSWGIFLTIPLFEKWEMSATKYWGGYVGLSLLYFTRQTGFFAVFYACYVLSKKQKRKVSNAIGVFVNAQFIIVNLIAWVVINTFVEKNNDPFFITIDILNHGVLFVLTLALFVVGLFSRVRNGSSNLFGKTLNYSEMFWYGAIAPTIFWIGSLIVNFVQISPEWYPNTNGYWSIYGPLTNFNPDAKGVWWMALLVIPAFYGVLFTLQAFFKHLDSLRFRQDRLDHAWRMKNFDKVVKNNKLLLSIFFISVIVYFGAIITTSVVNLTTYKELIMLWTSFSLMTLGTILIIYSSLLFKRMHTIYILRVFNDIGIIFAILSWIGCFAHLAINLEWIKIKDIPVSTLVSTFETLSMYSIFPLVALFFNANYTFIHYRKVYDETQLKK